MPPVLDISLENPEGIADQIEKTFAALSQTWATNTFPFARNLFIALASIQIVWFFVRWMLERDDPGALFVGFVRAVLTTLFFLFVLVNGPTALTLFIQSMEQIGSEVTGIEKLSPSGILDQGAQLSFKMLSTVTFSGILDSIGVSLLTVIAAIITFIGFIIIAGQMLITLIEISLILGPGVIMLAFGATTWTFRMIQGYIDFAISAGVRLFTIYLISAVGKEIGDQLGAGLDGLEEPSPFLFLYVLGISAIFGWLTLRIPQIAAGIVSGGLSLSFSDLYGTARRGAAVGTGVAAAGAGLAAGAGSFAIRNAAGLASSARQTTRATGELRQAVKHARAANIDNIPKPGTTLAKSAIVGTAGDVAKGAVRRLGVVPQPKSRVAERIRQTTEELRQRTNEKNETEGDSASAADSNST